MKLFFYKIVKNIKWKKKQFVEHSGSFHHDFPRKRPLIVVLDGVQITIAGCRLGQTYLRTNSKNIKRDWT